MAKRLAQALGVDIGTQTIKIAAVKQSSDGPAVTSVGIAPTIEGAVDQSGVSQAAPIAGALKEVIASSGGGIRDVIYCINGQSAVVTRVLEVPRMSDSELQQHMGWEIQRNIPFAETNVVSDFRPIENAALANSQNMEVVMAVSPQSAIDTVLQICKLAGVKAAAIDVEPLGLGRVLHTCHAGDVGSQNVCLVHIGHSSTAINMYRQGMLAFARTVLMGGSALTRAIAEAFNIPAYEAEEKKRKEASVSETAGQVTTGFGAGYGQPGADYQPYNPFAADQANQGATQQMPAQPDEGAADSRVSNAIYPQVDEFVAELRRSIDYYRSRGADLDGIVLSGGGSQLVGFDKFVERSLALPVTKLNPFQGIHSQLSPDAEQLAKEHGSVFAVAIGMGLHICYD